MKEKRECRRESTINVSVIKKEREERVVERKHKQRGKL